MHVLSVEGEAARILHVRGFHRDDDAVAHTRNRAGAGIAEAVFEFELKSVAGNLRGSLTFRRGAVAIGVGTIERDLHRIAGLFDAQLKNCPAVEEFLGTVLARPILGVSGMDREASGQR